MNTTPPRRRWFQFSLGTLFVVVTLFAAFLAYNINWIRQRQEALAHIAAGSYVTAGTLTDIRSEPSQRLLEKNPTTAPDIKSPWSIRLFGEPGVASIVVYGPDGSSAAENLRRLFPEASVSTYESPPPRPQTMPVPIRQE
jgi:hypothetical protein